MKKLYPSYLIFCCLLLWMIPKTAFSQNLSQVGQPNPIKISGNLGLSAGFYEAFDRESRRDPFSYIFNANINFNIYGVNIPFSAVYSQQETNFLQPFNRFGLSPYYKDLRVHLGYRNMTFSPFTLAGHTFLGAGIEFNPKIGNNLRLRSGFMYGRLRRGVSSNDESRLPPAYRRMGYGAKLGLEYGKKGNFIDLILFKAEDDINSIQLSEDDINRVAPQENLVLGLSGQHNIGNRIAVNFDYASSAFTNDVRNEEQELGETGTLFNGFGSLFAPRVSSKVRDAFQGGVTYRANLFDIGVNYKRIDTDYLTLGAYFFQNDLEDYTLDFSTSFFKNKLSLNASGGWQRNNLEDQLASRSSRVIAALNATYNDGDRLSLGLGASNFSSSLQVVQDQFSDSTNVYQVSQNYNLNANYLLVKQGNPQSLWSNVGFQRGSLRDEYSIEETVSNFMNIGLGHRIAWSNLGLSLNSGFSYNHNTATGFEASYLGPNVTLGKTFGKKRSSRLNYGTSLQFGFEDGENAYNFWSNQLTWSKQMGQHNLRLGTNLFIRKQNDDMDLSYQEWRGTIGYTYSFFIPGRRSQRKFNEQKSANQAPTANDFSIETEENKRITIDPTSNDTDVDNNLVKASAVMIGRPQHGQLINNQDGTFTYIPSLGFSGTDQFAYEVCDRFNVCDQATVRVDVKLKNASPIARNDSLFVQINQIKAIPLLENDEDQENHLDVSSLKIILYPTYGRLTQTADSIYTYEPNKDYEGKDQFSYRICDEEGKCDVAMVFIQIGEIQDSEEQMNPELNNGELDLPINLPVQDTLHIGDGEWLSKLAQKYYGDPSLYNIIYEANKEILDNPDLIYPDQVLIIPPMQDGKIFYTVAPGDNLFNIARRYNLTPAQLVKLNNISEDQLQVGMLIRIR